LRLELGHTEAVREQAAALLEELDQGVLGLSGSGEHAAALGALASGARTLATALQGLIDFEELSRLAGDLGALLAELGAANAVIDQKMGGVLLHAVGVLRQGLAQWGTGSRAGRLLPKIVADMRRVLTSARQQSGKTRPKRQPARHESSEDNAALAELRESFLGDQAGTFARLYELSVALEAAAPGVFADNEFMGEIFRLFHTVKGNALALGLDPVTRIAHAAEDLIQTKFSTNAPTDEVAAAALAHAVRALRNAVTVLRAGGSEPPAETVDEAVVDLRRAVEGSAEGGAQPRASFHLAVRISGREVMIPCENVVEILKAPLVMALPLGYPGWRGAVRSGSGIAPLLEPSRVIDGIPVGTEPSWVVVLKPDRGSVVSLPVDEPGYVVEAGVNEEPGIVLDVGSITEKVAS
jgi:chemotaxis protein histidine kinase CheA